MASKQQLPALLLGCGLLLALLLLQARAEPRGPKQKAFDYRQECHTKYNGVCGKNTMRPYPRPGRRSDPLFSPRLQRAVGMLKMPRIGRSDLLVSALDRRPPYDADDAYPTYDFLGDNIAYYNPAATTSLYKLCMDYS